MGIGPEYHLAQQLMLVAISTVCFPGFFPGFEELRTK
jgi:hypothetical protein